MLRDVRPEVMSSSSHAELTGPVRIVRVTQWSPGEAPRDEQPPAQRAVRWVEVDVLEPELTEGAMAQAAHELVELLGPHCNDELDEAMVRDLLDISDKREGQTYLGRTRSLSLFRLDARRLVQEEGDETVGVGGELVFHPVEVLAGEGWVVTCWHTQRVWRGPGFTDTTTPPTARDELLDAMAERWIAGRGQSAGDLAVMLLHELALSYKPACFAIRGWLEEWELQLYLGGELDRAALDVMRVRLQDLWGSMAQLREWIQPLNRPGITDDSQRAWFSGVTNPGLVTRADDQGIDPVLRNLKDLADTLRASFNVLHVQLLEEQRERRERFQRRLEVAAAAFLVPTLIVGFYGANTHVPGEQTWWGFWVMVIVLLALSAASVTAVWRWHQRADEALDQARRDLRGGRPTPYR
jgi:CorA-like Mg2+ transporter protein